MSVPGRLADILDQSLQDTGQVLSICHTIALLILEKKSDFIPMQKVLFLGYRFDLVSLHVTPTLDRHRKIQGIIQSLLNRLRWGHARMWQILLGLFAATEKLAPWFALTPAKASIACRNIGISIRQQATRGSPFPRQRTRVYNGGCRDTIFVWELGLSPRIQMHICAWMYRTQVGVRIGTH